MVERLQIFNIEQVHHIFANCKDSIFTNTSHYALYWLISRSLVIILYCQNLLEFSSESCSISRISEHFRIVWNILKHYICTYKSCINTCNACNFDEDDQHQSLVYQSIFLAHLISYAPLISMFMLLIASQVIRVCYYSLIICSSISKLCLPGSQLSTRALTPLLALSGGRAF